LAGLGAAKKKFGMKFVLKTFFSFKEFISLKQKQIQNKIFCKCFLIFFKDTNDV